MKATFARLRSGEWGVRIVGGHAEDGDAVTVEKKDGTTSQVTLGACVWSGEFDGEAVSLFEIRGDG